MKFFEDVTAQHVKTGYRVCGDHFLCIKTIEGTVAILCDGIGSGIYANIAATTCASRLAEHYRNGVPLRTATGMVAEAMHKARSEQFPFSAFVVAAILNDGHFDVYSYEAPDAIILRRGFAHVLQPTFFAAGLEAVGEVSGSLEIGDSLILTSDGVTQAGMGRGRALGIGSHEVAFFINRLLSEGKDATCLPEEITAYCAGLSAGRYEDDTSCALLHCRPALELSLFSGPPTSKVKDRECVNDFMSSPGGKIVCGSTTIDILSRELGVKATKKQPPIASYAIPPEYSLEGITLATEGALMLNQVFNILGEKLDDDDVDESSVILRFNKLLTDADVVHFFIGDAVNEAHQALIFKQMGIMPRSRVLELMQNRLRRMGKLVTERRY